MTAHARYTWQQEKGSLPLVARYAGIWNAACLDPATFRERSLLLEAGREPGDVRRSLVNGIFSGREEAELQRPDSLRRLGGISFLVIRDGWGSLQAVIASEAELEPLLDGGMGIESIVAVEGLVVAQVQAPGGIELHQLQVEVITPVTEAPPVSLNKRKMNASIGTLLDHAVVTYRHPAQRAMLRLGAGVMAGFRAVLTRRHFTEIQTPKIVAAATESGANVFALDYFGRTAFLAQSPQFYKQNMVGVFERVFEVGPVFSRRRRN